MTERCGASVPPAENPGVLLGIVLGVLARHGRDKVTLTASPSIGGLGVWLEQLLAESTGKAGKGLIPIDREPLGPPVAYGDDRLFVYVRSTAAPDQAQDDAVAALERAGQPVVRIAVADPYELGAEFFRWEIATAVAGAVLGINPFDQPDVEASKIATRALTDHYETSGALAGADATARRRSDVRRAGRRASSNGRARRLRRLPGIHPDERSARGRASGGACLGARPAPGRDLRRIRAALSPFDRTGVQGRPELRRVRPHHVRRRGAICRCPDGAIRSAW